MENKNNFLQKIRAVLIIMVIFIHSITECDFYFYNYIVILIRTMCNIAVPLFLFISGYCFNINKLKKEKKYINKKIIRLIVPLLIWNIIYFLIRSDKNIISLITFNTQSHLYYIIVLVQLILITPFIEKVWENKYIKVILYLVTPIYLLIYRILWIKFNIIIPFNTYYIFPWLIYYLEGIRIKKKSENIITKDVKLNFKFIPLFILVVCFNYWIYNKKGFEYSLSQMNNMNLLLVILIIFTNSKLINVDKSKEDLLVKIGDYSFGIYLSHMFILMVINKLCSYIIIDELLLVFIKVFLTVAISYIGIYLTNKIIPKKYCKYIGF